MRTTMKMMRIYAIAIIVTMFGMITYLIFRKKVMKSYDEGWFNGFTEATREIRLMRSSYSYDNIEGNPAMRKKHIYKKEKGTKR